MNISEPVEPCRSTFVPTSKEKIKWKKDCSFESPPIQWFEPPLPEIESLPQPIDYFQRYVTSDIIESMATMTNLYAVQNNVRFISTEPQEIEKFLGMTIAMGNLQYPRVRLYWDTKLGINFVNQVMTVNRFYKLRQNIHLVDTTKEPPNNTDRFWKVRPLYDTIRKRCYELPLTTDLSIDEQTIPFKGHINAKQYNPNKPSKWGIKNVLLTSSNGLMFDFILYQGSTTELSATYRSFGIGAAFVMKLCERIQTSNHLLVFDNYFGSYSLAQWLLQEKQIYGLSTIRMNRFANPPLTPEKTFNKKHRGASEEVISTDGVVITQWLDNKKVSLASTYVGIGKLDLCKRWDKKSQKQIQVPRPEVVSLYNKHMGGVDKFDFLVTIYRSFIRSKKWTLRLINHALDMAVTNSWLEYRENAKVLKVAQKNQLDLIHFRHEIAETLMYGNKFMNSKNRVGRPPKRRRVADPNVRVELEVDNTTNYFPVPSFTLTSRLKRDKEVKPCDAVCQDEVNHFPGFDTNSKFAQRCKAVDCRKRTFIYCLKCNIHLCISKESNCFLKFHSVA